LSFILLFSSLCLAWSFFSLFPLVDSPVPRLRRPYGGTAGQIWVRLPSRRNTSCEFHFLTFESRCLSVQVVFT
jgi:hypothetical protein